MDDGRFDHLSRLLSVCPSRRTALHAAAALLTGGTLGSAGLAATAAKRRKKKLKRNEFGCVNVGKFCKNAAQCCSGICQGKKGKKKCKAHDASTCQGQDACGGEIVNCLTTAGETGACVVTTGKANYCNSVAVCFACATDAECVPTCGAGAACIVCAECAAQDLETACAGLGEEGCLPV